MICKKCGFEFNTVYSFKRPYCPRCKTFIKTKRDNEMILE